MLKFVNVISKTISPSFKKEKRLRTKRQKQSIYKIETAYKRKAHNSAHTCIFHTLKAADSSQQVLVLMKV
jgi:hypothetical protein